MIVTFAVSDKDQDLALKNVEWWNELGGCHGHQALYCWDQRVTTANREAIEEQLKLAFNFVHMLPAAARIDGWPEGANYMFRICTAWLSARSRDIPYFLWMEPDAIPLKEGWVDLLEAEFKRGQKPFMGDRVEVTTEDGEIPLHMSGIGIYENPIYVRAGEAYRAFDTAWDMAAREQIVPNAHFTDLIEHAWKHPSFTSLDEVNNQVSAQTILFHSSKDGSLIDLARQKRRGAAVTMRQEREPTGQGSISPPLPLSRDISGTASVALAELPVCDIFIKTYPGDYDWLCHCLRSINQFATGFRKIWVVSQEQMLFPPPNLTWLVKPEECEDGYLAQQITKMYADVLTDYQADYILHMDSDVILTRPVSPADFISLRDDGIPQVIWPYTPYAALETPWQAITEKFLGSPVENEFMRRLPIMLPRWLYPKLREFCHSTHGVILSDYIKMQPPRAFSEFNAIGAYAFKFHYDKFHWRNTITEPLPPAFARQFHSWSGITDKVKKELEQIFSGTASLGPTNGDKLRMAATAVEGTAPKPVQVNAEASVGQSYSGDEIPRIPPGIKELPNGIWVLTEDTHISKWIEQEGRLDHDQNSLPQILSLINKGDVVVDAGAFVGDHTIAYAGLAGKVFAFEPNPAAFECLTHNMAGHENVVCCDAGLSDKDGKASLSGNNGNAGGAYLGDHMAVGEVKLMRLDDMNIDPDFIKLDVEGCEVKALAGMEQTISRCKPRMVIEVNEVALRRQGNTVGQLFAILQSHGYTWKIMQENARDGDPLYDIVGTPPAETHVDTAKEIYALTEKLKRYADRNTKCKAAVMWNLVRVGLKEPRPKKKKRPKREPVSAGN